MKGVFVPYSYYGPLHLSVKIEYLPLELTQLVICAHSNPGKGLLLFAGSFRGICKQGLKNFAYLFLHIGGLIVKSDQPNLPTAQVKHDQWLQQLHILQLPFSVSLFCG